MVCEQISNEWREVLQGMLPEQGHMWIVFVAHQPRTCLWSGQEAVDWEKDIE